VKGRGAVAWRIFGSKWAIFIQIFFVQAKEGASPSALSLNTPLEAM